MLPGWDDASVVLSEPRSFIGRDEPDLLARIETLRLSCWSGTVPANIAACLKIDALDHEAYQVVVFEGERLCGAGRLSIHVDTAGLPDAANFLPFVRYLVFPAGFMNRLVVHPCYRGKGISHVIDERRMGIASKRQMRAIVVEAKGGRSRALQHQGFEILGESPDTRYPGRWHILQRLL